MLSKIYDSLLSLFYPQACQICENSVENSAGGVACRSCWTKTSVFSGDETLCAKCGAFLHAKPTEHKTYCHRCDDHLYDSAVAVGIYEKALSASILNLKSEPFIGAHLKNLFIKRFPSLPYQEITLIVPVPLSKKRLYERGFNQATVLSKILSRKFDIALDEKSLVRTVDTPMHRAAMDDKAREMSVANVFEVARPKLIENQVILLVDDVFTSGATASSCAGTLKKSGAEKVYLFTLARVS